jgi:hypothetical protein
LARPPERRFGVSVLFTGQVLERLNVAAGELGHEKTVVDMGRDRMVGNIYKTSMDIRHWMISRH